MRRAREKLKENPQKYEEAKEIERKRYHDRKARGRAEDNKSKLGRRGEKVQRNVERGKIRRF